LVPLLGAVRARCIDSVDNKMLSTILADLRIYLISSEINTSEDYSRMFM
jgi:hypothetical protein